MGSYLLNSRLQVRVLPGAQNCRSRPIFTLVAPAHSGTVIPQAVAAPGALLSSDDFGLSVERTATLHPLWQLPSSWCLRYCIERRGSVRERFERNWLDRGPAMGACGPSSASPAGGRTRPTSTQTEQPKAQRGPLNSTPESGLPHRNCSLCRGSGGSQARPAADLGLEV
jgi:hypothetical protein